MYARGVFILGFLLLFSTTSVIAEVLTIESEPPQLIQLRKAYEVEKKQAASPAKVQQLKKKMAAERQDALKTIPYVQKKRALEAARDQELAKINADFKAKLDMLEKDTLSSINKKQQVELAAFKNKTLNRAHTNYIAQLEKLEKQLIVKSDLAGALVVQTERKKQMGTTPKVSTPAESAPTPKVEKATLPATEKSKPVAMSKDNPRSYLSTQEGIAGSSGNMKNNVYSFQVDQVGKNSSLVFHAYGKKTNDTYGEVYLHMPNGKRKEVAEWSPRNLKLSSFYDKASSAKDVKPVEKKISKYVTKPGLYKVEFKYKDGNEALKIYQVQIKTW